MFDGGIQAHEFWQIVEELIPVAIDEGVEVPLHLDNVDQEPVVVEPVSGQFEFQDIVVAVGLVLGAPIPAHEEMPGRKVSFDSQSVHVFPLALVYSRCMPIVSASVEELTKINLHDLFQSFGVSSAWTRGCLTPLFLPVARRFARRIEAFDRGVLQDGLQEASRRLLGSLAPGFEFHGLENLPAQGPLLIVSNHPGMTDTLALFAAIPRPDLQIVAAQRPFLSALPAIRDRLIFVSEEPRARLVSLRSITSHLGRGQAVLTFPAGAIEPDPALMSGASASLASWSPSIGLFVRLVPGLVVVPAIVSGVIAAPSLQHPLRSLRKGAQARNQLSASLQLIAKELVPWVWPLQVRVFFGPAIEGIELDPRQPASVIAQRILDRIRPMVSE